MGKRKKKKKVHPKKEKKVHPHIKRQRDIFDAIFAMDSDPMLKIFNLCSDSRNKAPISTESTTNVSTELIYPTEAARWWEGDDIEFKYDFDERHMIASKVETTLSSAPCDKQSIHERANTVREKVESTGNIVPSLNKKKALKRARKVKKREQARVEIVNDYMQNVIESWELVKAEFAKNKYIKVVQEEMIVRRQRLIEDPSGRQAKLFAYFMEMYKLRTQRTHFLDQLSWYKRKRNHYLSFINEINDDFEKQRNHELEGIRDQLTKLDSELNKKRISRPKCYSNITTAEENGQPLQNEESVDGGMESTPRDDDLECISISSVSFEEPRACDFSDDDKEQTPVKYKYIIEDEVEMREKIKDLQLDEDFIEEIRNSFKESLKLPMKDLEEKLYETMEREKEVYRKRGVVVQQIIDADVHWMAECKEDERQAEEWREWWHKTHPPERIERMRYLTETPVKELKQVHQDRRDYERQKKIDLFWKKVNRYRRFNKQLATFTFQEQMRLRGFHIGETQWKLPESKQNKTDMQSYTKQEKKEMKKTKKAMKREKQILKEERKKWVDLDKSNARYARLKSIKLYIKGKCIAAKKHTLASGRCLVKRVRVIKQVGSRVGNRIKSSSSRAWTNLKMAVSTKCQNAKIRCRKGCKLIKMSCGSGYKRIKTAVGNRYKGIKTACGNRYKCIKTTCGNRYQSIKKSCGNRCNQVKTSFQHCLESTKKVIVQTRAYKAMSKCLQPKLDALRRFLVLNKLRANWVRMNTMWKIKRGFRTKVLMNLDVLNFMIMELKRNLKLKPKNKKRKRQTLGEATATDLFKQLPKEFHEGRQKRLSMCKAISLVLQFRNVLLYDRKVEVLPRTVEKDWQDYTIIVIYGQKLNPNKIGKVQSQDIDKEKQKVDQKYQSNANEEKHSQQKKNEVIKKIAKKKINKNVRYADIVELGQKQKRSIKAEKAKHKENAKRRAEVQNYKLRMRNIDRLLKLLKKQDKCIDEKTKQKITSESKKIILQINIWQKRIQQFSEQVPELDRDHAIKYVTKKRKCNIFKTARRIYDELESATYVIRYHFLIRRGVSQQEKVLRKILRRKPKLSMRKQLAEMLPGPEIWRNLKRIAKKEQKIKKKMKKEMKIEMKIEMKNEKLKKSIERRNKKINKAKEKRNKSRKSPIKKESKEERLLRKEQEWEAKVEDLKRKISYNKLYVPVELKIEEKEYERKKMKSIKKEKSLNEHKESMLSKQLENRQNTYYYIKAHAWTHWLKNMYNIDKDEMHRKQKEELKGTDGSVIDKKATSVSDKKSISRQIQKQEHWLKHIGVRQRRQLRTFHKRGAYVRTSFTFAENTKPYNNISLTFPDKVYHEIPESKFDKRQSKNKTSLIAKRGRTLPQKIHHTHRKRVNNHKGNINRKKDKTKADKQRGENKPKRIKNASKIHPSKEIKLRTILRNEQFDQKKNNKQHAIISTIEKGIKQKTVVAKKNQKKFTEEEKINMNNNNNETNETKEADAFNTIEDKDSPLNDEETNPERNLEENHDTENHQNKKDAKKAKKLQEKQEKEYHKQEKRQKEKMKEEQKMKEKQDKESQKKAQKLQEKQEKEYQKQEKNNEQIMKKEQKLKDKHDKKSQTNETKKAKKLKEKQDKDYQKQEKKNKQMMKKENETKQKQNKQNKKKHKKHKTEQENKINLSKKKKDSKRNKKKVASHTDHTNEKHSIKDIITSIFIKGNPKHKKKAQNELEQVEETENTSLTFKQRYDACTESKHTHRVKRHQTNLKRKGTSRQRLDSHLKKKHLETIAANCEMNDPKPDYSDKVIRLRDKNISKCRDKDLIIRGLLEPITYPDRFSIMKKKDYVMRQYKPLEYQYGRPLEDEDWEDYDRKLTDKHAIKQNKKTLLDFYTYPKDLFFRFEDRLWKLMTFRKLGQVWQGLSVGCGQFAKLFTVNLILANEH